METLCIPIPPSSIKIQIKTIAGKHETLGNYEKSLAMNLRLMEMLKSERLESSLEAIKIQQSMFICLMCLQRV